MTNHTPAPWSAHGAAVQSENRVICNAYPLTQPGRPFYDDGGVPEQEANARLIAAAPDLLEALLVIKENHYCRNEETCSICAHCGPAIAKATEADA